MEGPLKAAFGDILYCCNPSPDEHIPELLAKYESLANVRILCDTIGWLHTLQDLLDKRVFQTLRLQTEINNWLARKKPKKPNSKKKSKIRKAVEDLKDRIKKETVSLHEMVNKLPKAKQFKEMYDTEKAEFAQNFASASRKKPQSKKPVMSK